MKDEDLSTLYELCPNISILEVNCKSSNSNLEILTKFEELESLILYSDSLEVSVLTRFLKKLNDKNKLKNLFLPKFKKTQQENILEFFETLFEKTNLNSVGVSLSSEVEVVKLVSCWIEKNSTLNRLVIESNFLSKFKKDSQTLDDHLDSIFDAVAVSKSIESLSLKNIKKLNLEDLNSLKFIETNSTLKSLNFSGVSFSKFEMEMLNDSLKKNDSISILNLSCGNFLGPFGFLEKKNLKEFTFQRICEAFLVMDFLSHLKNNKSLTTLELSLKYIVNEIQQDFDEFFVIMSSHSMIKFLSMDGFDQIGVCGFHKLLKNPNLKELKLIECFSELNQFEMLMNALNDNESLKTLDVSYNRNMVWKNSKIHNKTLQHFVMEGNGFDFSNLLQELLNIPSLQQLQISENQLGRKGVEILCNFLETDSSLSKLSISGKKIRNH
jgi:hypothetical protein